VGTKEGEGPLADEFDCIGADDKFGQDTWEAAESSLQQDALTLAIGKSGKKPQDLRYLFAGDLLGQLIASSFGLKNFEVPLFGLYGACSTSGEALALGAMSVAAGYADCVAAVTSSHFGSAEKQFRFPLEYANQRPVSATWTVTGAAAFVLEAAASVRTRTDSAGSAQLQRSAGLGDGAQPQRPASLSDDAQPQPPAARLGVPLAKITGVTTGRIVDYGIKDSMNMGAVMAPAACELIAQNLADFGRRPRDYDRIITGDLGAVGQEILFDLLGKKGYDISKVHEDCGMLIYDSEKQGTGSGGSGCGCAAVTLSAHLLPKLTDGEWKRILFVPTGALLSTVSFNEGQSIPGIAHGVVIEAV
jgi:stage V sporulation protein AD